MKAQILKLGGVTTEAEFYKKFPTEEAFMAKHGKQLKKAQKGNYIPGVGFGEDVKGISDYIKQTKKKANRKAALNMLASEAGPIIGLSQAVADKYGRQSDQLDQWGEVANLAGKARSSAPAAPQQKYVRPEDQMVQAINPLGVQGFGYFEKGGEIQNTYAPIDIYSGLGYEPLNDSDPKQYQNGGGINTLFGNKKFDPSSSNFMSAAGSLGGGLGSLAGGSGFEQTEEGELLSTIGGAAGTALGGPVGGLIGAAAGGLLGGVIGGGKKQEMKIKRQNQYNAMGGLSGAANVQNMFQGSASVKYGGSFDSMEDGGWVSHNWQPQVITKFGNLDVSEVHSFAHDGMDEYRAGGHLKEYTPPSAEALQTFGEGGQLQTLWGGGIKEAGVNPIIGKLGMLSGGYHSQRAADAPGQKGIGVNYGGNIIEAENGEGIVELANGGKIDPATGQPSKSAYIFGAEKIQGWAKKAIEDPDIKIGTTFKHWYNTKAKLQKKLNKKELDAKEQAANLEFDNPIAKLRANAIEATLKGIEMQNIDLAKHITNGAAVQTAINETDEEMGTAKYGGVLKKAAFGAKMTTAAAGANLSGVHPAVSGLIDLLKKKGYASQITSGKRSGKTSSGRDSRHNVGEAVDMVFPKLGAKAYKTLTKDPDVVKYMMDNGLTAINEYDPGIRRQTGGTGPHIHFGLDKGTGLADRFRNAVSSTWEGLRGATEDVGDYIKSIGTPDVKTSTSDLYKQPAARRTAVNAPRKIPVYTPPSYATAAPQQAAPQTSGLDALDMEVNRRNAALLAPKRMTSAPVFPSPMDNEGNYYMPDSQYEQTGGAPDYLPAVAAGLPSDGLLERFNDINIGGQEFGSYAPTQQAYESIQPIQQSVAQQQSFPSPTNDEGDYYMPTTQQSAAVQQPAATQQTMGTQKQKKTFSGLKDFGNQVMTGLQSTLPYLRPSNQQELDPSVLSGEMFALATNQLEPVQAQKYVPYLSQPMQISLQDQMNEITSQTRAAERLAQGDPTALSIIAAQAYGAKNRIKGEEFRLNQAEKQRVAETNRQVMNEANRENLGILDNQYVRQQTAKSKTKEQAMVALNSISDKILKNKLENKELGVYENMYNFRFGPNGQAYNTNVTSFNVPNVGNGATSITELTPLERDQAILDAKKAKASKTAGQGAIVKAMHEL